MKTLAYALSVFLLVVSILPATAAAAPGNTPPWVTEAAGTPNAVAICTAQKGIGKELCALNQTGTSTAGTYSQPVNGACPVAGTTKVVKCEVDPNPSTTSNPTNTTNQSGGGFVSLTKINNVTFAGNAAQLPDFLNSIYMICIGLAAVIGVLQIMRAGVTWMTAGGSHEKIGDAKNLIRDTIIGLVLVLAPTIVFSIINPDILKLQIRGLSDLQTDLPTPTTTSTSSATDQNLNDRGDESNAKNDVGGATIAPPPTAPGCSVTIRNSQIITDSNKDMACCASQDTKYVDCQPKARSASGNTGAVNYCGCSIKPNLGMEFYDLYAAPYYESVGKLRYETDLKKLGTTPAGTADKFNTFQKGCKDAGGKFEVTDTRNILQSKYIVCPADAGAPASNNENVYRCMPMKATCTTQ